MALSDGRKSFPIGLAVLIQYRSVTASQPASHVAVAITLNAKASSLKTELEALGERIRYTFVKIGRLVRYTIKFSGIYCILASYNPSHCDLTL